MYHRALKLIRQYHRLSQIDAARRVGISASFMSELEKEDGKKPSIDVLEKYATAFNLPISSLLLFAERTEQADLADKSRVFAADKVLKMLEWIEDTAQAGEPDHD